MNSLKTGLCAQNPVHPTENVSDYEAHKAAWLENLKPDCFEENHYAQVLIDTEWRLSRIRTLDEQLRNQDGLTPLQIINGLDKLSRHEMRLRKLFTSTMEQFLSTKESLRKYKRQKELAAKEKQNGFVLQKAHEEIQERLKAIRDLDKLSPEMSEEDDAPFTDEEKATLEALLGHEIVA